MRRFLRVLPLLVALSFGSASVLAQIPINKVNGLMAALARQSRINGIASLRSYLHALGMAQNVGVRLPIAGLTYATAPTIGSIQTSAQLTNATNYNGVISTGLNTTNFRFTSGFAGLWRVSTTGQCVRFYTAPSDSNSQGFGAVEFMTDATTFEFGFRNDGGDERVWVDGVGGSNLSSGASTGALNYRTVTFTSRAMRWIRIEFSKDKFFQLRCYPYDMVIAPIWPAAPRCVFFGDSFVEGSVGDGGTGQAYLGVAQRTGELLGWDVWASGSGGTGWQTANSKLTLQERATGLPGYWLLSMGGPTGGSCKLTFDGVESGAINYNDTVATVKTTLEGVSSIGSGNVDVFAMQDSTYCIIKLKGTLAASTKAFTLTTNSLTYTTYTATPTVSAYQGDIIPFAPDIVIISGGYNDRASTSATTQTNMAASLAALKAALPNTRFFVVGPWWPGGVVTTGEPSITNTDAACSAANTATLAAPYISMIPGGTAYFTGSPTTTGAALVTLGSPSAGTFTFTNNGHTTAAVAYNATASTFQSACTTASITGTTVVGVPGGPYIVSGLTGAATGDGSGLTGGTFSVGTVGIGTAYFGTGATDSVHPASAGTNGGIGGHEMLARIIAGQIVSNLLNLPGL